MRTVFILIGPKGSGKSFIGRLISNKFGLEFIEVERIFMNLKGSRSFDDQTYIEQGFKELRLVIEEKIASNHVVFESTGLTNQFSDLLEFLKGNYEVRLINITAPLDVCLERTQKRESQDQIQISDVDINAINKQSVKQPFPFDFVLENVGLSEEEIVELIQPLITDVTSKC